MKDIAAGDQYTQFLNPELFYQFGSIVYHLPVDPVWSFIIITIVISALGITSVYYVTSKIFGREEGLYTAFALVVMSVAPFRSIVSWMLNSYISAYIFLPLFLLTLYRWKETENPVHILTGSIVILLIGGFHHLVFLETVAFLGFAFLLVDRRVVFYLPAVFLNVGVMWENYGRYLSERGIGLFNSVVDNVETLLSDPEPSQPAGTGDGSSAGTPSSTGGEGDETASSVSQFGGSSLLDVLSLMAMVNPFVLMTGGVGFISEKYNSSEGYSLGSRILLSWILGQVGMILFTYVTQPNATERTVRHLFIPFAMMFGVGFKFLIGELKSRDLLSGVVETVDYRAVLLAIAVLLSTPMLVYQVTPFGGSGYTVHPDSELTEGLENMEVEGTILAPPLTDEVVGYYHDGPVFRTYPRDFSIPAGIAESQAKVWEWWNDPSKCELLHDLDIDWVFIDKRNYFDEYWNDPENVRVPQDFDQSYLELHQENAVMKLYEVNSC